MNVKGYGVYKMFSNRYVRTIILSQLFLQTGIWIRNFAVLLYVTQLTNNNPVYISLVSVAEFAPIFLFAMIGGAFADRWRPKRTMVWSDLLSAFSVVAVDCRFEWGMDSASHWNFCFLDFVAIFQAIIHEAVQAKCARGSTSGCYGDITMPSSGLRSSGPVFVYLSIYSL